MCLCYSVYVYRYRTNGIHFSVRGISNTICYEFSSKKCVLFIYLDKCALNLGNINFRTYLG